MWSQSDYNDRLHAVAIGRQGLDASVEKVVLIAHRRAEIRDRFAAALADARHGYITADSEASVRDALRGGHAPISLALIDLGLGDDGLALVEALHHRTGRTFPLVVFAGTVTSAEQVRRLLTLNVAGYVNEHAATPLILPALAPHLFPDSFNRRVSPRVVVGLPASYRAGQAVAAALTLNIGRGGLAIRTLSPLAADTTVQVKFRLPGRPSDVDVDGQVAWSDRMVGMGIRFDRLSADDQAAIDAFVERAAG